MLNVSLRPHFLRQLWWPRLTAPGICLAEVCQQGSLNLWEGDGRQEVGLTVKDLRTDSPESRIEGFRVERGVHGRQEANTWSLGAVSVSMAVYVVMDLRGGWRLT